eukprot:1653767-Amphidinium_carterae.3
MQCELFTIGRTDDATHAYGMSTTRRRSEQLGAFPSLNLNASRPSGQLSIAFAYNPLLVWNFISFWVRCPVPLLAGVESLKDALGDNLATCLEQSFILSGMRKSPTMLLPQKH